MAKTKKKELTEITWISLCDAIDDGDYDEGLNEIARTVQTRLEVRDSKRARRMIAELDEGTRVMITNKPTPRYLQGMLGTVISLDVENSAARIELDHMPTRTGAGRPSAQAPSKNILIPFIHLMIADGVASIDPADLGDDDEEDDD